VRGIQDAARAISTIAASAGFAYLAPSCTRSQASALKAGFGWIKRDELGSRTTPDEGGRSSDRQPEAPDIERLRFYAEQFNTVEVDSTFYAFPTERNAKLSAERTPEGFVFNIKPFALMTQHPADVSRLPEQLRGMLPADEQSNRQLTRPSKEVVDMAFQTFWSAMAPLHETGSLGWLPFSSAVFHSEACKLGLPRASSRMATGSFDRNRVPSSELGSRRISTHRNDGPSAIAWPVRISIDAPEDSLIVPCRVTRLVLGPFGKKCGQTGAPRSQLVIVIAPLSDSSIINAHDGRTSQEDRHLALQKPIR
jgi:hypothetical protein